MTSGPLTGYIFRHTNTDDTELLHHRILGDALMIATGLPSNGLSPYGLDDEFLQVLEKIWTDDIVEFKGKFYTIPASKIGPKPVQKPHIPIY